MIVCEDVVTVVAWEHVRVGECEVCGMCGDDDVMYECVSSVGMCGDVGVCERGHV